MNGRGFNQLSPDRVGRLAFSTNAQKRWQTQVFDFDLPEEEAPDPSVWQRGKPWLIATVAAVAICLAAFVAGDQLYKPQTRIPALSFATQGDLLGTNQAFLNDLETIAELFATDLDAEFELQGEVFEVAFPRTVADRIFGERNEKATIFSAETRFGRFRFLVLWDDGRPVAIAAEAPSSLRAGAGPEGLFLALPASESTSHDPLARLAAAIEGLLADLDQLPREDLSNTEYTVFGPFAGGRTDLLQDQVVANTVVDHLANRLEAVASDVSLVAPAFLVLEAPARGVIRAVYLPQMGFIQAPLWGLSETSSLAHELVHAFMDRVPLPRRAVLRSASEYFERVHPRLYGQVVGDLYERLGPEGRAEESLAFLTGALASRQIKTVASLRLLENQSLLAISEPILNSDIDLLIEIGLLPECMAPQEAQPADAEIGSQYYESASVACGSGFE